MNVPPESSGGVTEPVPDPGGERPRLRGDLAQRLAIGVEHRRHHQRVLRGDRDADVHPLVELEAPVLVAPVRPRELLQRQGAGLHDEIVERRHDIALARRRLDRRPLDDRLLHVDVGLQREVGHGRPRLGHPPRDHLLRPRQLLHANLALGRAGSRGLGGRRGAASTEVRRAPPFPRKRPRRRRPPPPRRPPSRSAHPARTRSARRCRRRLSRAMRRATGEALTRSEPSGEGASGIEGGAGGPRRAAPERPARERRMVPRRRELSFVRPEPGNPPPLPTERPGLAGAAAPLAARSPTRSEACPPRRRPAR